MYALPQGDDPDDAVISECGSMNLFFVLKDSTSAKPSPAASASHSSSAAASSAGGGGVELVTPPLDGTILPGVTRDSILQLARR